MRSVFTLLFLVIIVHFSYSQINLEAGYLENSTLGTWGFGGYVESKYAFNADIQAGIYLGINAFFGLDSIVPVLWVVSKKSRKNGYFKPYLSLGFGLYNTIPIIKDTPIGEEELGVVTTFGFQPRVGVDMGKVLTVGLSHNVRLGNNPWRHSRTNYPQLNLGLRLVSSSRE